MRATTRRHRAPAGGTDSKFPMDPAARRFTARHRLGPALALTDILFHEAFGLEGEYRLFVDEFVDYAPGEDQRYLNFEIQYEGPGKEFHERLNSLLERWSPAIAARARDRLIITFRVLDA